MPEPLTLSSAVLSSDYEDEDYAPDEHDSDSEAEAERGAKKPRVDETKPGSVCPVTNDAARNVLWESFLNSTTTSDSENPTPTAESRKITIERRHWFAGEDVIEKVQIAEDSREAIEWKNRQSGTEKPPTSSSRLQPTVEGSSVPILLPHPSSGEPTKDETISPSAKSKIKPRKSLSSMAAATKVKKLTTLEKSKLDWQSHLNSTTPEERDELERNRQAGGAGYLEKVDFLVRVDGRREDTFENSKRKRR